MNKRQGFHFSSKCLLALTAGLAGIMSASLGCQSAAPVAAEQPVPKVTVTGVISQETVDTDEYTGRTEASEIVDVRARVFGFLKTITFKDGDYVREGQTLFTIEPDEYAAIHQQSLARIALNNANLELAKANLARKKSVVKSGAISQEEYEEAIAAVRESEAKITAAQADANRTAVDLKYTDVKAPISGRIDRAMVSKGNLLTGGQGSGTLLTKIVCEQPMYVYFDVDERSLLRYMKMRTGDRTSAPGSLRELGVACYVQLADEKDFTHQGSLDFASAEVNASTGTARLRGVFANKNRELVSGLFVRVRIPVSQPYKALLIPEKALATDQNLKFVYVVGSNNEATRRTVELGAQRGDLRIVKSGLTAGERVIVKGLQRVKPGQKVEAELEQPPVAAASVPVTPAEAAPGDKQKAAAEPKTVPEPKPIAEPKTSTPPTANASGNP
ncbi:MAG: efflux RND transporter periplasmic adaptor subunit [Planctomycetia bacterium]|nr:efflux RND transporter periplasmic adaptor subunit [Planctomycetia bacterium]